MCVSCYIKFTVKPVLKRATQDCSDPGGEVPLCPDSSLTPLLLQKQNNMLMILYPVGSTIKTLRRKLLFFCLVPDCSFSHVLESTSQSGTSTWYFFTPELFKKRGQIGLPGMENESFNWQRLRQHIGLYLPYYFPKDQYQLLPETGQESLGRLLVLLTMAILLVSCWNRPEK